jgi:hypothetical protein
MIHGAHVIIYSKDSDADRAFFRDVLEYPSVDAGHGWLIFGLPRAEVGVHPSDENDVHELYLMTDDAEALVASMRARGVAATPVADRGWGLLTQLTLPGGGKLGVYEPRHARPQAAAASGAPKKKAPTKQKAGTTKRPGTRPRRTRRRSRRADRPRRLESRPPPAPIRRAGDARR